MSSSEDQSPSDDYDSADDHDPEPVADEERLLSNPENVFTIGGQTSKNVESRDVSVAQQVHGGFGELEWVRASAALWPSPSLGSSMLYSVDRSQDLYVWSSDEEGLSSAQKMSKVFRRSMIDK